MKETPKMRTVWCVAGILALMAARTSPAAGRPVEELVSVLKSDAALEKKVEACRTLAQVGDGRAVPALAEMLTDEKLSHMARYALEPIPDPSVDAALRGALGKLRGNLLIGVIGSIGVRRDAESVPALVALLRNRDEGVARAAAHSLAQIATPPAVEALATFRKTAPDALKPAAVDASLIVADRLLEEGRSGEAAAVYRELEASKQPRHIALAAFRGLLKAEPEQAASRVARAIGSEDAVIRATAISQVPHLKDAGARAELVANLEKMPPAAQVLLVGVLSKSDAAVLRPALGRMVGSPHADVRAAAVEALGRIGDAGSVPLLCKALSGGKTDSEKQAAAASLLGLKGDRIDAALVGAMKAAAVADRSALIGILTDRGAVGAVSALLEQARQPDPRVRAAALRALGNLASPRNLPELVSILAALEDASLRTAGERMVAAVARKGDPVTQQVKSLVAELEKAPTVAARCSLLKVLGAVGDNAGLPAVRSRVTDGSPDVSDTAVRVLADWPDPAALPSLLNLVNTTRNRTHKALLLRGSVRLLGLDPRGPDEKTAVYAGLVSGLKDVGEKRLVLSGLGKTGDAGALSVVEPLLADPEVREEAELAALNIARRAIGAAPDTVTAAMKRLAVQSKNEETRKQAAAIVGLVDRFEGYVVAWQVSGPYTSAPVVPPEKGEPWKAIPIDPTSKTPWMMDLAGALGGGVNRLCFVRTSVHSASEQRARLDFGTDDANEVWLNGKSIFAFGEGGAAIPGEHKVPVTLSKGWNTLILKVTQITGPWQFCLRIVDAKGRPLQGLRYRPAREPPPGQKPVASAAKPAGVAATPQLPPPADDAPGWTPLFNGKDLAGWHKTGNGIFKVEDGCLVGTQTDGKGGDLWTEAEFTNFELRVTYRMVWPGNSGFWFRYDGGKGYQYDVLKYTNPVAFSGTLYCPGKLFITRNLDEALESRDGWNKALLRARGEELTLWLNGKTTGHCRDNTLSKGKIGIQVHGSDGFKGMEIVVKQIDVRPL